MLNKKCLFFGGLYLVNIIAIFVSILSDVIAKTNLCDFRSELNQIAWESKCSTREDKIQHYKYHRYYDDDYKHSWILDKYYEESRTRVIGKAIGDCVADEGEFKGKEADNIITFENTRPELYEQKNWNAVILYNYVHEVINGNNLNKNKKGYCGKLFEYAAIVGNVGNVREVLKNKLKGIKTYYEDYYKDYCEKHIKNDDEKSNRLLNSLENNLDDAVKDIQKYVDALKLNECLFEFRQCKRSNILVPNVKIQKSHKLNEGAEFFSEILLIDKKNKNKSYRFWPTISCYDNRLYIVGLKYKECLKEMDSNKLRREESDMTYIKKLAALKNEGKLLLERLDGLVELPTEELWNKWHQKDKK